MAYQRKTKDWIYIIWNGEKIDQFETRREARAMLAEYNLAYGGGCKMRAGREKI